MENPVIKELESFLSKDQILKGGQLSEKYNHIWNMNSGLKAVAFLLPSTTQQISEILKTCDNHNQPIVVFGGLTNLVGSTETKGNEIVISMEKMNRIEEVDPQSRTMTVGAGVILEDVQKAAKEKSLIFPLNFGAKGSAQIGGAISTNAGGLRVLKFGMTRSLVLGLEVVLMDGTILSSLKKIIKDNSAYDLKQLFIGSEGTIGVVTKAVLKLVEAPKGRNSAFIGIKDYEQVVQFLKLADQSFSGSLSGFELIWKETYLEMTSPPSLSKPPLPHDYNYYVLIESLGNDQAKGQEKMEDLLNKALELSIIEDAVIAFNVSDLEWFWKIREDVHVLVSQCSYDQHYDISIPISKIGKVINEISTKLNNLKGVTHVFPFGHVADGNIHFVVGKADDSLELRNQINDIVYAPLMKVGGSVSAEHGIGLHKKDYLALCRTPQEISAMKRLKLAFDPKGLLNPGKVLDIT